MPRAGHAPGRATRLYLAYISRISRLYLAYISPPSARLAAQLRLGRSEGAARAAAAAAQLQQRVEQLLRAVWPGCGVGVGVGVGFRFGLGLGLR